MEKYQVKSNGNEPFLLLQDHEICGTLNYPSAYNTTKAEIRIKGSGAPFEVKAPGLLKTNLELWQDAQCIATSRLGWDLGVALAIGEKTYRLKVTRLGKGEFSLLDHNKTELVKIKAGMDWMHAKAAFELEVYACGLFNPEVLLFLVHNCNYFLALSGNDGSTEALLSGI